MNDSHVVSPSGACLLVCVPTFNEEHGVLNVITDLRDAGFDVVVIDGHSTDRTVAVAENAGFEVVMRDGFGKAAAVNLAMRLALERGKDFLALIDADGSYSAADLRKLVHFLGQGEMVTGCRPYHRIPFSRRLANNIMNSLCFLTYGRKVRDMASGMRIIRVASFLPQFDAVGFNVEPQLWCLAANANLRVVEMPIDYHPRIGISKSAPIDVLRACCEILRLRLKK